MFFITCAATSTQCPAENASRAMFKQPLKDYRPHGKDDLFLWTIIIIVLTGLTVLSWIGSFYVFGHPEKGFSYRILRTLDKIDTPKRFGITKAPRGQFLDADKLLERYATLAPAELGKANDLLLRHYLRNYEQSKDLVPYAIGSFNIMGTFRLGPDNFFPDGVVALAQSTSNPAVLLELIFPAEEKNLANLEHMLPTGLDVTLARTHDLTAVINVRPLPDGRFLFTAVPLLYGSYTSTETTGSFSLEPPTDLHVGAGLPVLNDAALDAAAKNYAAYRQRAGLPEIAPSLMRIAQPEVVSQPEVPIARALPVERPAVPAATPRPAATPYDRLEGVPIARALPATAGDSSVIPPALPVSPAEAAPTPAVAAPSTWQVYQPGLMPRGRLIDVDAARRQANAPQEPGTQYLAGDFSVTAAGTNRAVLRSRQQQNVRVIVDFPDGLTAPAQGETVVRDAQRPFQVSRIEETPDGMVNVYVREITRP